MSYATGYSPSADWPVTVSRSDFDELITTLEHARKFITSRQKMHESGVELYDECISKFKAKISITSKGRLAESGLLQQP